MTERRPIPGYEGRYEIDDAGAIYSLARTFQRNGFPVRVPSRKLAQHLNRNGYPFVRLNKAGSARTFEIHRLVCRVFHGEPAPEGDEGSAGAHRCAHRPG